jgi:large subunit ribosomal protein L28
MDDTGSMAGLKTFYMAKTCDITGKKTQIGGKYSNRTRATQFNPSGKTKRSPNLQNKKVYVAELDKTIKIKVSTKGIRTIAKNGAYKTLKAAKLI